MAQFQYGGTFDEPIAEHDLSDKQYYIVTITGDNQVDVCSAASDKPRGILWNKPGAGEVALVLVDGVSRVISDAALTAGQNYGTSGDGQAVAKAANGDHILGKVLVGSGGAGAVATVTVNGNVATQLVVPAQG